MISLEDLCLNVIVRKFERFYFAYSLSKDNNLQRNFNFLQRRFSDEILTKLYRSSTLKEEYLEFLINEHVEELVYYWLEEFSIKDIFLRVPNLKIISFWHCDDEILESLAKYCPKLSEIYISGLCDVTDRGVGYLCKDKNGMVPIPELKNLFIKNTNVTDRGVECLIRNLPFLERIDYDNVPLLIHSIHEENLREFKTVKFYNLTELSFLRSDVLSKSKSLPNRTDILKTCLTLCPKLEYLSCYISENEQLDLLTNIHLEVLRLEFPRTGPIFNIDFFLKVKRYNLTNLKISDCTMSMSTLALHSPNLHYFYAKRVIFSDDDDLKVTFSYLWRCKFIDIQPSSYKGIWLVLSSSPELDDVTFRNCMLSLELKKQILLWGKGACNIGLEGIDVALELEFLTDILLYSPSLSFLSLCDESLSEYELIRLGISQNLENFANSLPNKPEVCFSNP